MFGFDAGTLEQKGQLLEAFFEQWGAKQESGCHVATSQRHDVRSTMQKSTIRNVVTFQRRDVATSQRRDVSTGSALHLLKHEWFGKRGGASGGVRTRARNSRAE